MELGYCKLFLKWTLLFFFFFFFNSCNQVKTKREAFEGITADTTAIVNCIVNAEKVSGFNPDSAIKCYQLIFEQLTSIPKSYSDTCYWRQWLTLKWATVHQGIAAALTTKGEHQLALEAIEKGIERLDQPDADTCMDLSTMKTRLLNSKSIVYKKQGNYLGAIEIFRGLLQQAEEKQSIGDQAIYLTNIANIYQEMNEHTLAIEYLEKAHKFHQLVGNQRGIAACKITLGNINNTIGNYDIARNYYMEAIEDLEKMGLLAPIGLIQSNLGVIEKREGNYAAARQYYSRALENLSRVSNRNGMAMVWGNIADLANETKNYSEAIKYAQLQLEEAKKSSNLINQRYAHKHLYKAYKALGKSNEALAFFEEFVSIKDSIASTEKRNEVSRLESVYQDAKKKQQIQHLEETSALLLEKNRQNKILLIIIIAFAIAIAAATFFWIRASKADAQRKAIDLEQRLLRLQMNPHFFFNVLTSIHAMAIRGDMQQASDALMGFARLTRLILESSREEFIPISQEIEICERYAMLQSIRFPHRFSFSVHIEPTDAAEKYLIPPMLLQPFVENAIEHAFPNHANGNIKLSITRSNESLICMIDDNGVGMKSAQPNEKGKHQSLAIHITRERLSNLKRKYKRNTQISIHSPINSNGGTRVLIEIPCISNEQ